VTTIDQPVVSVHDAVPIVDPEFQALVPALHHDERALLEQSLTNEGCRDPLVVWQETGILLDGHNRLAICTELGITFATTSLSFESRSEALLWVIENQLGRRNLTDIDRIALAAQREPLLKKRAEANRCVRTDLVQNSAGGSQGVRTRDVAASAAGVSHDTYTKGKLVLLQGTPELVQAVRDGDASIHAAAEIALLPTEEQRDIVSKGYIRASANKLRNRRSQNTGNNEWGTPRQFIDAVREVSGGSIDLDPATHANAQARIQATTFYTADDDGLTKPWFGRVFLNPPYSKTLIKRFVDKLVEELTSGNVESAILLTNNETDAAWFQKAAAHANHICFPAGRLKFLRPDGRPSRNGPLQGQAFLHFGAHAERFVEVFAKVGIIVTPTLPAKEKA